MNRVSVVIPSHERHQEVQRAVRSALAQTLAPVEVIVSNDGPDPEKGRLLAELGDNRVRFVEAPRRRNASATRNFGVQQARGDWIALLDDDDVWLPGKLEAQFAALERSGLEEAILAGVEVVYANGARRHVRPSGAVPSGVSVSELLFCGYGGAHTSTLMAPRWAFEEYPFDVEQERHEDWSWMLQAGQELGVVVAPEEVCERHLAPGEGLSRPGGSSFSRGWYDGHKQLMTPGARAAFVANILSRKAAHDRKLSALPWIVVEVARQRGFNGRNLVRMVTPWLVPSRARKAIKAARVGQ
ncbi:glycosyltransferase family 2 protein [Aquisalimonas sp. 2447]|uniref:glycosyltransferase family 2 protein n=1 Tax=Aquisalimonas sp. 2447 TaxID=2740807 RepID=UPI0014323F99|nr:glycosyltransferase family 2 protein [Aquisalimonas sp. 2447]QIT55915.1 glycosyltransferase family 2 protein [Aquisalimonas sp. 2447]